MTTLRRCLACGGFAPGDRCPNCDAAAPSLATRVGKLIAAGGAALTLMACYGAAPMHDMPPPCPDSDADGFCPSAPPGSQSDCNDTDPKVFPGAPEVAGDGVDQNCDGQDCEAGTPGCETPATGTDPAGTSPPAVATDPPT